MIKTILESGNRYEYLDDETNHYLGILRTHSDTINALKTLVSQVDKNTYRIHPWLGTYELFSLEIILRQNGVMCKTVTDFIPLFIEVTGYKGDRESLELLVNNILESDVSKNDLTIQVPDLYILQNKYNEFVPSRLLIEMLKADYIVNSFE